MNITHEDQKKIDEALAILKGYEYQGIKITSTSYAQARAQLELAGLDEEAFGAFFLTQDHTLIQFEILFKGTINASVVYPRVIAKRALELNAASVVITHNHPSGSLEASNSDLAMTQKIKNVLKSIDVELLDHILVTTQDTLSFAEKYNI